MHLARLKAARDGLDRLARAAKESDLEFAMRFNLILLADIISCLGQWRGRETMKHWPAWMWRVAFSVVEESETFLERQRKES